jgi:hypothetical protein
MSVPIVIVFFNRSEPLKEVYEAVRKSKTSQLFLVQDGPRENNPDDKINILKCREIFENIDWDCEVKTNYSDCNLGCGERVYSGLNWVFGNVDKAIILEDDCVPSASFFPFCEELLVKYENDFRISQICGMNHLGEYKGVDESYFFSNTGSCWGWATWKRAWDLMEFDMPYLKESQIPNLIKNNYLLQKHNRASSYLKHGTSLLDKQSKNQKLSAWTYQFNMTKVLYSQFNIVSTKNLINNIGMTADSTHTASSYKILPSGVRDVYFQKTHKIKMPIIHPKYLIVDDRYETLVSKMMGYGFWRSKVKTLEYLIRKVVFRG